MATRPTFGGPRNGRPNLAAPYPGSGHPPPRRPGRNPRPPLPGVPRGTGPFGHGDGPKGPVPLSGPKGDDVRGIRTPNVVLPELINGVPRAKIIKDYARFGGPQDAIAAFKRRRARQAKGIYLGQSSGVSSGQGTGQATGQGGTNRGTGPKVPLAPSGGRLTLGPDGYPIGRGHGGKPALPPVEGYGPKTLNPGSNPGIGHRVPGPRRVDNFQPGGFGPTKGYGNTRPQLNYLRNQLTAANKANAGSSSSSPLGDAAAQQQKQLTLSQKQRQLAASRRARRTY